MIQHFTIKNFLTEKECNDIIEYSSKNLSLSKGLVGSNKINESIRKSSVSFTNYDEIFPFIKHKLLNEIPKKIKVKGYEINFENQPYQFTTYNIGEYYHWHKDSGQSDLAADRYCSVVIQLNNEYEGGNLEMEFEKDQNFEITKFEKGKGNLFVFLSNIRHRVTEVTNGTRYSLVSWFKMKPIENFKKTLI